MRYGHDGMGTGGWVLMSLMWLLLLVVIVGLVVWAFWFRGERDRRNATTRGTAHPLETPLGILQHRLARGEIDEASYERLRARLTEPPPPPG
jgi:uncharacterized membrane protein